MSRVAQVGSAVLFVGCAFLPIAVAGQRAPLGGLDEYIVNAMAQWGVPGLAIGIVQGDSVVYLRGYGVREAGKAARVDEHTVFALSSNSKAFASAAIGTLVDEGRIDWDDPVTNHLPWFRLPDPWVTGIVTLRDLLSHRVAGDMGDGMRWLWEMTSFSGEEVLRRLRDLEPGSIRFRSQFDYGNPNVLAAGEAAAAVAGTTWQEFVESRLLDPLDMTSATTSVYALWDVEHVAPCYECDLDGPTPGIEDARIDNLAMPHVPTENGPRPIPWRTVDNIAPAGSINAGVEDVVKFLRFQLGQGVYEGRRVLTEATIAETHSPQIVADVGRFDGCAACGHIGAAGLGWALIDYRGRKMVSHGGGITGFRSTIALLPEEDLGVVALSNMQLGGTGIGENHLPKALVLRIFDAFLGAPEHDWSAEWRAEAVERARQLEERRRTRAAQRVLSTRPSLPSESLIGTYRHPAFGQITIRQGRDNLMVTFPRALVGDLEHWHYDLYRLTWRGPHRYEWSVRFRADRAGVVTAVEIANLGTFVRADAGS